MYLHFRERGEYRSVYLDVSALRQIGKIGDLWEGLECKVLREERRDVTEVTSKVGLRYLFYEFQLGGGGVNVGHRRSVWFRSWTSRK